MAQELHCECWQDAPPSVWWRIGGGAFLAMNAMVLSLAVNGSEVTQQERHGLELAIICLVIPVYLLLTKEFAQATWLSLKERRFSLEFLFLLGMLACLGSSALSLWTGAGGTYADVAGMLLVIYALGRQIGAYGKARVMNSLQESAPERRPVHLLDGTPTNAATLQVGDRFRVFPGEAVPVDARIIAGTAFFHEASMTGESFSVSRTVGETILAGGYVLDASVECEAIRAGDESNLDRIRNLISAGVARPGKEQRLALQVLRWFVPTVMALAGVTFWWHSRTQPWDVALFHALSVVVVACPCALGFATPLAIWTAIARLREMGLVARSGESIEQLAEIDTIVFDKTGTLTLPEQYQVQWTLHPAWQQRAGLLRYYLREAELASHHPIARALAPLWTNQPITAGPVLTSIQVLAGRGIQAQFSDGILLFAGGDVGGTGGHQLIVTANGEPAANIDLIEMFSPSAAPAVRELEASGLHIILSTGDTSERASAAPIREQLSRQSPEDKHTLLMKLQTEGHKTLFVGDGLNDAAAMAWSHVSCTVVSSSHFVQEVSGLMMLHQDWSVLPMAIAIAKETRRVVRHNVIFSLVYNFGGMLAAATGLLHPVVAACVMMASSFTVILYSMRLGEWEPHAKQVPAGATTPAPAAASLGGVMPS